jgi:hypothetical protein
MGEGKDPIETSGLEMALQLCIEHGIETSKPVKEYNTTIIAEELPPFSNHPVERLIFTDLGALRLTCEEDRFQPWHLIPKRDSNFLGLARAILLMTEKYNQDWDSVTLPWCHSNIIVEPISYNTEEGMKRLNDILEEHEFFFREQN